MPGTKNEQADKMLENAEWATWSDTELDDKTFRLPFTQLVCTCGSKTFEIAAPYSYCTCARCTACKKWYIVHSG